MDLITLAMAKPKVIDLDKYGIGATIMYLFQNGGGASLEMGMEQFWSDINTDRVLRLEMNVDSSHFLIDQCARAKYRGDVQHLIFSISAVYDSVFYTINVFILKVAEDGKEKAEIVVKVSS